MEDHQRHRKNNAAQNLALLRGALIAIIPFDEKNTLNDRLGEYKDHPRNAIKLVHQVRPD